MADQVPDAAAPRRARTDLTSSLVRVAFVTEESIYGIILVSGMIVVTGTHGATSWFVFWTVLFTVVVFWAAHVYAGTVARHAFDDEHMMGIREAFAASLRHSLGLLASSFIPLLILLLGATQGDQRRPRPSGWRCGRASSCSRCSAWSRSPPGRLVADQGGGFARHCCIRNRDDPGEGVHPLRNAFTH